MKMQVTRDTIDKEIEQYLRQLEGVYPAVSRILEANRTNPYALLESVKREPLHVEPYQNVSLFELANRAASDLILLFGVRSLFRERVFPFESYELTLGTEHGDDISADTGGKTLSGEAFNVAQSFFQTKRSTVLKKFKQVGSSYKVMMFNSDAINDPSRYHGHEHGDVMQWVVNVTQLLVQRRS
ncbi:MAG: hypothetical protein HY681_04480 [Chloroflexi bacterium]|nr:hypothetical protein [Chloroflexota bacterium]